MESDIQYCTTSDGVRIAYRMVRGGEPAVVIANNHPFGGLREAYATYIPLLLDAITPRHTIVWYDGRGHGYSQRDVDDFSFESRLRDMDAIVAVTQSSKVLLVGTAQSTPTCIAWAARHPATLAGLIVWSVMIEGLSSLERPETRGLVALAEHDWGLFLQTYAHLITGWSEEDSKAVAETWRDSTPRHAAMRYYVASRQVDVRSLIPDIAAPVLVMHTVGIPMVDETAARTLAAELPRGRLRFVEGIGVGSTAAAAAEHMREFISEVAGEDQPSLTSAASGFRTVLFTDLVGHTEMMRRLGDDRGRAVLREHERITRDLLKQHGGAEVKTMGDGFMASFASVTKAMDCAIALQRAFAAHEGEPLQVRVGLNAGEPIEEDGDLFGSTVIMASRIAAQAGAGEILIPEPLRHLLSGKSYIYRDRGETMLKGFEDAVRLYEVRWRD
jgi:class 3 adenylate cyclase